ncbi:hypothetical protein D3C86_1914490 [compost metagenome]
MRGEEVGIARYLPRFADPLAALPATLEQLLNDTSMQQRLAAISAAMQATRGTELAARAILALPTPSS